MKPWKLITTDDPAKTLGEGRKRHYATLIAACNAFAKSDSSLCKQIIFDNGHDVRWLDAREQRLLHDVCDMLGYDLEDVA